MHITRREFVVGASAFALAGSAMLASLTEALAQDPNVDELMKPGTLPDLVQGKEDAPITIIEYASMTCPHCAAFHKSTYPALKSKYIDTGKVRFIFREYPLDEVAVAASMLARCAGGDKALALIDVLFNSQDTWAVRQPIPALLQIGKQPGLHAEDLRGMPRQPEALYRHRRGARARQQGVQGGGRRPRCSSTARWCVAASRSRNSRS